jgi:glycosyltransferase involved in cell wall biosynthesis
MRSVIARRPDARLVMVGGDADQVTAARTQATAAGVASAVLFTGQRPSEEVPDYLDAATVLASPRSTGTNTPLKIYQYLRSGRPIVATNLRTHTQVLSHETAFLADPTPEAFGAALLAAIEDPVRAEQIGRQARDLAETKYSDEAFIAKTRVALTALAAPRAGATS